MNKQLNQLSGLFYDQFKLKPEKIQPFPSSGSNRKYYRIISGNKSAIGVIGDDPRENRTFIEFSRFFRQEGLNVPLIYNTNDEAGTYLQEDLGDESLFNLVTNNPDSEHNKDIEPYFKMVLNDLIEFQLKGGKKLDFNLCYPVSEFDKQAKHWDLNYFKYYFLKPSGLAFNEASLEKEFGQIVDFLDQAEHNYFMYRDFQTRNIIIRGGKPWYIDYQGGRKGPLHYDLASLLFQAKTDLSPAFRERMLGFYLEELKQKIKTDHQQFSEYYYGFVLLRSLQVLGAYGFRGYFEQKPHFIESISFALKNIKWLITKIDLKIEIPELLQCLSELTKDKKQDTEKKLLTVTVNSFSYKKNGYPKDTSGHGGGFVFDCRSLPNPGRIEEYRLLTGKDQAVVDFLAKENEVKSFLDNVKRMIAQAVDNYLVRGFNHLTINFGCTGGQHRSVYCAEQINTFLRNNYRIKVKLSHKMLD